MAQKKHLAAHHLALLAFAGLCACGFGQADSSNLRQPVKLTQAQIGKPSPAVPGPATPPSGPSATATSLLDQPAQPAKVNLNSGKLTIQADNSSLGDILHQVAHASGMKIEGLQGGNADQRIFGNYGPGAPRDVLSDLLSGSGYNVLMLGVTPSGAPREVALALRSAAGSTGAQPAPDATQSNEDGDDDAQSTQYQDDQQSITPPPNPPEMRNDIRTPQQMLQELQRMHEQQQQQPQQPDQQPN